jgi:archaellum component FlaC
MIQNTNKIITKYLIPKQIQDVLIDKRKNIQPSLNHLTVSINSGSTNMRGGSNKNNTLALYPKITMNGGSHPYASLDGGAWNPSRGSPNPVATLDARIKSLEAEFKSVTGKNLGPLSGDLRRHADNLNTTIGQVQNSLQVLSSATEELNRHPVGLGIDASTFNEAKLREIASHAEEYNKNLTKASKQINTLDRAANMLEELVSRSRPAART